MPKANLGYHLWIGNNPNATGYYFTTVPPHAMLDGAETSPPYYRLAFSWIAENPKEFVTLTLKRIVYFWYVIPERQSFKGELVHGGGFLLVLAMALYGAIWSGDAFRKISLLLLFFGIFPLLFYVTHASFYRHRFHIEPFILILASRGLHHFWLAWAMGKSSGAVAQRTRTPVTAAQ